MTDSQGRALLVRNSYLPERESITGIDPIGIKDPKTPACVSRITILTMVCKLGWSWQKKAGENYVGLSD